MLTDQVQLQGWLTQPESEHLEFKEAKEGYSFDELAKNCAALANAGGGELILGVREGVVPTIVGTHAYRDVQQVQLRLNEELNIKINVEEIARPEGRLLIFHVPSRPPSRVVSYKGVFWVRMGESITPMSVNGLKQVFSQAPVDFSSQICQTATISDLDAKAIEYFRQRWDRVAVAASLTELSPGELLNRAGLVHGEDITYAALILLGSERALSRYLGQAEIVFEYRSSVSSIQYHDRKTFRQGFVLSFEAVWDAINLRNNLYHYQHKFFVFDIPAFNQRTICEAILNAVCHRDYTLPGSIFIRQYPTFVDIVSPGGFPSGVTPDNVLNKHAPRNRLLGEALQKVGFMEGFGTGVDMMYSLCIRESKPLPDFSLSDETEVYVRFRGEVEDTNFVRFLDKVGDEKRQLSLTELMALDTINRRQQVPPALKEDLNRLLEGGLVMPMEEKSGAKYMLSPSYYDYSRKQMPQVEGVSLSKEQAKTLILSFLTQFGKAKINDLEQLLATKSKSYIRSILRLLAKEGKIEFVGASRSGYWRRVALRNPQPTINPPVALIGGT